jgi:hypothetical protein
MLVQIASHLPGGDYAVDLSYAEVAFCKTTVIAAVRPVLHRAYLRGIQ